MNALAKCPKCGRDINYLNSPTEAYITYYADNRTGKLEVSGSTVFSSPTQRFLCPWCLQVVAKNPSEALKILAVRKEEKQ